MDKMKLHTVGYVETVPEDPEGASVRRRIRIREKYLPALEGVEELEHLWVLFWFHRLEPGGRDILKGHPCGDKSRARRGVFALRSPVRPNPIGLTRVRVLGTGGDRLLVEGLDAWPGTPVLDLKPATEKTPEKGAWHEDNDTE